MNTLVIVLVAAVCLIAGYVCYGRWLAAKWGIDPKAKTPAVEKEDGEDYVPTDGWTVFAHQFSSIAGAGPVTGAIQAAVFGWVPVFLWIVLGGIFFGAVTDFGALYASVKNEGKSMGLLIEQYIGKTGRKLFLLFCWLFTLIVTAAFADMVAGTFNAYVTVDGASQLADAAQVNGPEYELILKCLSVMSHLHFIRRNIKDPFGPFQHIGKMPKDIFHALLCLIRDIREQSERRDIDKMLLIEHPYVA